MFLNRLIIILLMADSLMVESDRLASLPFENTLPFVELMAKMGALELQNR